MAAIEASGLTKQFGDVTAVQDFDLEVAEGEVYGLIGPNGSGKSTVFRMLLDFAHPTAGSARIFGHDVQADRRAVRERIGVVPQGYTTYDRLTGREHLEFVGDARGVDPDSDAVLERVGLREAADRRSGEYSSGMQKRLMLAMALVGDPDLLLLDEPFSGLDPRAVLTLREIVEAERDRGTAVFFSSHLFREVEIVCDRVALLLDGERIAEDTVAGLRRRFGSDTLQLTVDDPDGAVDVLGGLDQVAEVDVEAETVTVRCAAGGKATIVTALRDAGIEIRDFETTGDPLEAVFLAATDASGDRPTPDPVASDGAGGER